MIALVKANMEDIAAICRTHGVRKLDIFGSAATGKFNPSTSDLDFVVDFIDYGPGVASRFIDFVEDMEQLFNRPVDLVFDTKMDNPYFRRAVEVSRELVYDASRDSQAAA